MQIGQVNVGNDTTFTLALGFGRDRSEAAANAATSLTAGFAAVRNAYENGWHTYLGTLKPAPKSITSNNLVTNYNVALMALKAMEDKTVRGAHVASLSIPWGQKVLANNCCEPGYHRVWARDLYQVATAQLAAGDSAAANRSLDYLLDYQQIKTQDGDLLPGAFPRFSRLDGSDRGCCEQLDQDAFPLILAWQLNRTDAPTWAKLKLTADHIVGKGPITPSERWEEQAGISPSTVAAEIAGLVCAADIADKNGNTQARDEFLAKADDWQQSIEKWTFTTNGILSDSQYYFRIDTTDNGDPRNPNDGAKIHDLKNGGGNDGDERSIVDAGFLELVRLGVKPVSDPKVSASLPEIDSTATIRVTIPNEGDMWHRYNRDGYGEQQDGTPWSVHKVGIGRLWPILSGERGEYELASGNPERASELLKAMANAANQGFMIPEQVWDQEDMVRADGREFVKGQGTDSATPLAWSMAQFVRLAQSIDTGKLVETPKVVADRYATQ